MSRMIQIVDEENRYVSAAFALDEERDNDLIMQLDRLWRQRR